MTKKNPLLEKIVAAAEDLIERDHFSIETLCLSVQCSLKDLGEAVGTMDDLVARINDRFLAAFLQRAAKLDASAKNDAEAFLLINAAWLDHALAHPRSMDLLLQHRWTDGYQRPDWYVARINECFLPAQRRLAKLAPQAKPETQAGICRGIYAHICGLYYLSMNERAKPAGIDSIRKLLELQVKTLVKGLQAA
jgi:AcrR family transcriptional regulator